MIPFYFLQQNIIVYISASQTVCRGRFATGFFYLIFVLKTLYIYQQKLSKCCHEQWLITSKIVLCCLKK